MQVSRRRRTGGSATEIGPELLANGDFASGSTGWTVTNADGTHIVTFGSDTCRYQSDTTSPALTVSQPGVLTPGKTYRITATVSAAGLSGRIKSDAFAGPPILANGSPGTYTVDAVAVATAFNFLRFEANVDLTLDRISVRQVGF